MTICGAKTRAGGQCQQAAGWGTQHVGQGKCKLHGGLSTGPPVKTGRYSLTHRKSLEAKAQAFANDPHPADLTGELTLMRALLQDYLDRFSDSTRLGYDDIERLFGMMEAIGRLVERIAKMLNATALTQAEVQYLQARIADLLSIYVPDSEQRARFLSELAESIGVHAGANAAGYIEVSE
jgi:hypothetical protein